MWPSVSVPFSDTRWRNMGSIYRRKKSPIRRWLYGIAGLRCVNLLPGPGTRNPCTTEAYRQNLLKASASDQVMVRGMVASTVVLVLPTVSVTLTLIEVRPAFRFLLGVPESTPALDNVIPDGSLTLVQDKVA